MRCLVQEIISLWYFTRLMPTCLTEQPLNMRLTALLCTALLCLTLWQKPASAVLVEDLYTVTLPIADQTVSLRLESFREAFQRVIVKVSGSDEPFQRPEFEQAKQAASRYIRQFSYVSRGSEIDGVLDESQISIRIEFETSLIEELLRRYGYPVWGGVRPTTLMLIAYDVNERVSLVADETSPQVIDQLDQLAANFAVPVIFPLLDLEDLSMVDRVDVQARNFNKGDLLRARYEADALLMGQIQGRSGEGWRGQWEVRFGEQIFQWDFQSVSRTETINQVIAHLAKVLALEYALESQGRPDQPVLISISAIDSINGLLETRDYLESLSAVEAAQPVSVTTNSVTYKLSMLNEVADLQRLIELGSRLEQVDFPQIDIQATDQIMLNYQVVPR